MSSDPALDSAADDVAESSSTPSCPPTRGPIKVSYCQFCTLPHEYCEFSQCYEEKCKPWIEKHMPELLISKLKIDEKSAAADAQKPAAEPAKTESAKSEKVKEKPAKEKPKKGDDDEEDEEDDEDEDEESGEGESADEKDEKSAEKADKPLAATVKAAKSNFVTISKSSRSKNKYITSIVGLDSFGVDIKKSCKLFSKKFASAASVVKVIGGVEIQVQGDIVLDSAEWIANEFKDKITKSNIYFIDKAGKKTKAF